MTIAILTACSTQFSTVSSTCDNQVARATRQRPRAWPTTSCEGIDMAQGIKGSSAVCIVEGCDVPAVARSWCARHYYRGTRLGDVKRPKGGSASTVPEGLKHCTKCDQVKSLDEFSRRTGRPDGKYPYCRTCNRATAYAWRNANPDKAYAASRRNGLRRRSGTTPEQYDQLFALQGGRCAICGTSQRGHSKRQQFFAIDHHHGTGAIRGLLCSACNMGIGQLGDSPERLREAADYIERSR